MCLCVCHFLTALSKPTLKYLMKELYPKSADKWEDIGIELEVDDGLLVQIRTDYPGDSKKCLRETLRIWLKRGDPHGTPLLMPLMI